MSPERPYDYQARCLYAGFVAGNHGISVGYAWTRYAKDKKDLGEFWYQLAEDLERRMAVAIGEKLNPWQGLEKGPKQ